MDNGFSEGLLTPREAARFLGKPLSWVYRQTSFARQVGEHPEVAERVSFEPIPVLHLGGELRFERQALLAWVRRGYVPKGEAMRYQAAERDGVF